MKNREPLNTAGGNVSWYNHYQEHHGLKKLNTELPYDLAILILGIYPEKIIIQKDACTPKFTAALFTAARHGSNLNVQQRSG